MARTRTKARLSMRQLGITVFLLVLIVWLSTLVVGIYHKEEVARGTVDETRSQLAALDARKASLSGMVNDLDTDRGQEASLRETFGVAKPGEDVIVVVPQKELPPPPKPTFWQKLRDALGI